MAGVINSYETVIVTSAKLGEEGNTAIIEKFQKLIAKYGTVESVDDWGKRRFAYEINKETEGYYTLINFKSEAEFTAELDRRYIITDGIVRTLIIKKDPRFLKPKKEAKPRATQAESAETAEVATQTQA